VGPDSLINQGNPPSSAGRRVLNLYRALEIGPVNGTVTRVAWGPDSDATFAATYPGFIVRLGHKQRDTSLTQTGLFAQFDVDGFVTVVNKVDYTVPQAFDVNGGATNDGFLNYPKFTNFFEYNGNDDVLLDVEAKEGNTYQTHRTFLALTATFGTCNCVFFAGCVPNNSIGLRLADSTYGSDSLQPPQITGVTLNPSPYVHVMQFELAKLRSDAESLYYNTFTPDPDYLSPIINPLVQAAGATAIVQWGASADGIVQDVPFSTNIDDCDGFQYLKFHVILRANLFTGGRARIALFEVPFIIP
jgi:hypothetical protein